MIRDKVLNLMFIIGLSIGILGCSTKADNSSAETKQGEYNKPNAYMRWFLEKELEDKKRRIHHDKK